MFPRLDNDLLFSFLTPAFRGNLGWQILHKLGRAQRARLLRERNFFRSNAVAVSDGLLSTVAFWCSLFGAADLWAAFYCVLFFFFFRSSWREVCWLVGGTWRSPNWRAVQTSVSAGSAEPPDNDCADTSLPFLFR